MGPIVFLLLPTLGYASITVNIKASPAKNEAFTTYYGKDSNIITDIERESFEITNKSLTAAIATQSGGVPLNVYVRSPTPWGDLYKIYSWTQVNRETKVKQVRVLTIKTEEVTLAKAQYTNNSTIGNGYTNIFKYDVENKISKVFTGKNLSVDVLYNVDLLTGLSPPIHLKFLSHLGNNTEMKDTRTLQPDTEVKFNLKPSQSAIALLNATKVTMMVKVTYETNISGEVAANYNPKYKGHHFWKYDVKALLKSAGKPSVQKASDLVTIQYFSDAKVVVVDNETGRTIQSERAGY